MYNILIQKDKSISTSTVQTNVNNNAVDQKKKIQGNIMYYIENEKNLETGNLTK